MRTLVIGYGSIGQRHARLLGELGCEVAVVSARAIEGFPAFRDMAAAIAQWKPQYVVVANKTHDHHDALTVLARSGFDGRVLVEKPLFDSTREMPSNVFANVSVAYNMRFHPLIRRLRDFISGQRSLFAGVYVGQYLPNWRPQADYRNAYSARRSEGGGVLRDLSHELDYMNWLFGGWGRMAALGGHFSSLDIDSDDVYSLALEMENCPVVNIHLNYLDRVLRRELLVHTDRHSVKVDFVKGEFEVDGTVERIAIERDATYLGEHRSMLAGDFSGLCSIGEGYEVLKMIESAEIAVEEKRWVMR